MRTRICKNCGKAFEVPTGKESYLCEECSRKSKSNSVLRERTCKICGASFVGYPRSFQRYNSGLPKSGVVGVTYHRQSGKWQAKYKQKYIGLYDTAEQAAEAVDEYKNSPGG